MRDMYGNEIPTPAANTAPAQGFTASTVETEATMEAGKVLAMAGGAAGVLAGILVLLTEREKKEAPKSTLEQAKALIEEAAAKAREEGGKAEQSLLAGVQGLRADAGKRGKQSRKTAKKAGRRGGRKGQAEANETLEKIAQFLREAREEAAAMASREAEEVSGLAKQFRSDAGKRAKEAQKASKSYSRQARTDAERAKGELSSVVDMLKSRVLDAEHHAEDYLGAMVLPKVKELIEEAQGSIETGKARTGELRSKAEKDVIPEARKRAEELRNKAETEVLPEAKKRAEELRKLAEKDLIPEAKKKAEDLTHVVEDQAAVAATKLSTAAHTVEEKGSEATEAVKRGTRETRSLLLWLALAGVLVFTVFLDEEQQKRLKEIAFEIFGEAKDMYADMKGEETFQS